MRGQEGRGRAYELTCHVTGRYPHWWEGRRFDHLMEAWVDGKNSQTTRDIVQAELLGKVAAGKDTKPGEYIGLGTGMIPEDKILHVWNRAGRAAGAIEVATYPAYFRGHAGTRLQELRPLPAGKNASKPSIRDRRALRKNPTDFPDFPWFR